MAKASKPKPKVQIINRDAKDGQFTTPEYVKKHPNTTVVEKRPLPKPPKKKT